MTSCKGIKETSGEYRPPSPGIFQRKDKQDVPCYDFRDVQERYIEEKPGRGSIKKNEAHDLQLTRSV